MANYETYVVNRDLCSGCEVCCFGCPTGAIYIDSNRKAVITDACLCCGVCEQDCPTKAIKAPDAFNCGNIFK